MEPELARRRQPEIPPTMVRDAAIGMSEKVRRLWEEREEDATTMTAMLKRIEQLEGLVGKLEGKKKVRRRRRNLPIELR